MAFVLTSEQCRQFLHRETTSSGGLLNGCTIHLFTNDYTPLPTSEVSDFTECTGDWYDPATVSAGVAYFDNDGVATCDFGAVQWVKVTGSDSDILYGYYIVDGNAAFLGGERFASPEPIADLYDELTVYPKVQLSGDLA
jgi:hypothetical protein